MRNFDLDMFDMFDSLAFDMAQFDICILEYLINLFMFYLIIVEN